MALFDTIKNNRQTVKQGGELSSTSTEELQSLTRNAGMPTPPSSPLSAFGIGANADQAKMLGTPAQQTAAINIATAPQQDLQTQLREAQARKEQNAQEAADRARAMTLTGFGSLGERVQQLATKMFNTQTAEIAPTQVADRAKFADHLAEGADEAETEALLNKVGDGSATNEDILKVAQNLGYKDVSDVGALTDSIKSSFLSNAEREANFTADTIPDTAKVSDFTPEQIQSLGFNDLNAMATALQVDPDQLSGMSIKDLQNTFGKEQMEDFGKVAAAQATLADPSTSRAEKENALKQLRELGATGVRAVEGDVKRLEAQVANADEVKFNGQQYRMEDLLKSDTIAGIVKSYLVDDDVAKSLQIQEPEFANWIESNKKVLALAAERTNAKVEDFKAIQDANQALQQPNSGAGPINSDVMKLMFPDWGHLSATKYQAPPVLDVIKNIPSTDAVQLQGTMTDLANTIPTAAKGIATASANALAVTGLNTREGARGYLQYAHVADDLSQVSDDASVKARIFPGVPQATFDQVSKDASALESFGFSLDHNKLDILTSSGEDMKSRFIGALGGVNPDGSPLTVEQMAARGVNAANIPTGDSIMTSVRAQMLSKQADPSFIKYGQYWAQDHDLLPGNASNEGDNVINSASAQEYDSLRRLADTAKMNPESKRILDEKLSKAGETIAQKELDKVTGQDRGAWDGLVGPLMNPASRNAGQIEEGLKKLQDIYNKFDAVAKDPKYAGRDIQYHMEWRRHQMWVALTTAQKWQQDHPHQKEEELRRAADMKKAVNSASKTPKWF